jgi:hypothetical protein
LECGGLPPLYEFCRAKKATLFSLATPESGGKPPHSKEWLQTLATHLPAAGFESKRTGWGNDLFSRARSDR